MIIRWRDIPAQVNAGSGDEKVQRILPRRFQRAIDNAAMVAGKSEASQYIGEWRRTSRPSDGEAPEAAALRVAAELEALFPAERWRASWRPAAGTPTGLSTPTATMIRPRASRTSDSRASKWRT